MKPNCPGTHKCAQCGHTWECYQLKAGQCGIEEAASTNKTGPLCGLCHHLEMARRHAALRHLTLTITRSDLPSPNQPT